MSKWISYNDGEQALQGYLAPAPQAVKAPGVLIFPAWLGVSASIQDRAERISQSGYTAFAADIFGKPTLIEQEPARWSIPL